MDKLGMMHVCLLVMIQWISLAVVVLNGVALSLAQKDPQLHGQLISATQSGPQDKLLIITGILSFLAATFPLCLHLRLSCQSSHRSIFTPTAKKILLGELAIGVVMVTLITGISSIVMTHFHVLSNCQLETLKDASACKMFDMAITLGLGAIVGWVILLIIASINMARLPIMNTPEFVLETNPYLIGHYALEEEKKVALSSDTTAAPPIYTPSSPQLPPPSFSSVVTPIRYSHHMTDVHPPPPPPSSRSSPSFDYPADTKYPIYTIDSLPTILTDTSKFDLSFFH